MILIHFHLFGLVALGISADTLTINPRSVDLRGGATVELSKDTPFISPVHAAVRCIFGSHQVRAVLQCSPVSAGAPSRTLLPEC